MANTRIICFSRTECRFISLLFCILKSIHFKMKFNFWRMTFWLCDLGLAGLVGKWWTSHLSWWGLTHRSTLTSHLQVPLVADALEEWREETKGLLLRRPQVEMEMRKTRIKLLIMSFSSAIRPYATFYFAYLVYCFFYCYTFSSFRSLFEIILSDIMFLWT